MQRQRRPTRLPVATRRPPFGAARQAILSHVGIQNHPLARKQHPQPRRYRLKAKVRPPALQTRQSMRILPPALILDLVWQRLQIELLPRHVPLARPQRRIVQKRDERVKEQILLGRAGERALGVRSVFRLASSSTSAARIPLTHVRVGRLRVGHIAQHLSTRPTTAAANAMSKSGVNQ